jgi:hypothetical protein
LWAVLSAAPEEGTSIREIVAVTSMSRRWIYYRLSELASARLVLRHIEAGRTVVIIHLPPTPPVPKPKPKPKPKQDRP